MSPDANTIADLCFKFYKQNIPAKVKPTNNEWTTLAAIILGLNSLKIQFNFKMFKTF